MPREIRDQEEASKTNPHWFIAYKKEISGYNENYYISTEDIGFKNAYIFGQNEPKWQTKGLLSKGVFEHLKDKNIREGVHVYVQAGLAKSIVPPALTSLPISHQASPQLTFLGLILKHGQGEQTDLRGRHFPFTAPEIRFFPALPRIS